MPRYLVERTFQEEAALPFPGRSEAERQAFIDNNAVLGVVWIHSYISPDRKKCFCLYDASTPEAVRTAAARNRLPVERIIEVHLLDPYAFPA